MDILNTKIKNILAEKATKIKPENIKKDVTIFNITGTYESEYNVKINSIFARTSTIQNSITEIQEVDFSNLTNADSKLASMPNLVTVSLKNTNKITNFTNLFKNDTALKNINLFDTGKATNMAGMFSGCSSIENIPLFNTSKAQTLATMFLNCTSLKIIPAFDGSSLTNVTQMFEGCTALTSVPLFDTSHVVVSNCQSMFKNCTSLQTVPQFNFSGITTSMNAMFTNCPSLSDESLNNIMAMCAATGITNTSYMSLAVIGLSSTQANHCTTLSNWASFSAAGWTTGY